MHRELGMQMERGYEEASALESSLVSGAQNTYLGQLAAEGKLLDTIQQGEEAAGGLSARAGASGIKGGGTLSEVLQSQMSERASMMRKQIDSGREMNMAAFGAQARGLNKMRSQFDQGSSFMDLYSFKRGAVNAAADLALQDNALDIESAQNSINYAGQVITDQDYWQGGWWAADLFDVVSGIARVPKALMGGS